MKFNSIFGENYYKQNDPFKVQFAQMKGCFLRLNQNGKKKIHLQF